MGIKADQGAVVDEVTSGTGAASAGLQAGDVITRFGDKDIPSSADLRAAIRAHKPGDKVDVTFERNGSSHTVSITLGSRPTGG